MVIGNLTRVYASFDVLPTTYKLLHQQLRYGNRPNLQRPRPPHFDRVRMLQVCQPVYPPKPKNCLRDAMEIKRPENPVADNPYGVFLAGQMRRDLAAHPLVVILHHNSYSQHELINIRGTLYDMNYQMKIQERINQNVARLALTYTKWSPLIHLFKAPTAMGFCTSDSIPALQKALKKMPQFTLIAAVVHGRILHKTAIDELAKLRDINNVRALLTTTLSLQSVTLSQNLAANVVALSHSLDTYSKGDPPQGTSSSSSSSDSDSDSSSDSDKEK